jgi:probable phosphomutase (TIGR03848 family)
MPTILLIRHGENDVMLTRLAGRMPNVHLNKTGRAQAAHIAAFLADRPIHAIFSSPLERALETAQPLAALKQLEVQVSEGLNEIDFGKWQGKRYTAFQRPKTWKLVQERPSQVTFQDGESYIEAQKRVVAAIEDISSRYGKEDVIACFTHADVIRLAVSHYLGMELDNLQRLQLDVATITELNLLDGKAALKVLGQQV